MTDLQPALVEVNVGFDQIDAERACWLETIEIVAEAVTDQQRALTR